MKIGEAESKREKKSRKVKSVQSQRVQPRKRLSSNSNNIDRRKSSQQIERERKLRTQQKYQDNYLDDYENDYLDLDYEDYESYDEYEDKPRKQTRTKQQKNTSSKKTKKNNNKNNTGNKKSSKVMDFFLLLIVVIAIGVAGFAGYRLYTIMQEYKAGVDEYSSIAETVVTERDADEEKVKKLKNKKGKEVKKWTAPFDVDFNALKEINPDVSGWIYMEALPDITYPIVQGTDNDFYLHHTYKKESLFAGSIFMDCKNSKDFSDQNTIVYGHNMKNGSMFGTLKNYKKPETSQTSPYFWIITPKEAFKYKIFAVYTADVNGNTYTLIKGPGKETIEYGDKMEAKSEIKFEDHEFKETDKMITLSTCTGNSATRFVVQGVRVEPE